MTDLISSDEKLKFTADLETIKTGFDWKARERQIQIHVRVVNLRLETVCREAAAPMNNSEQIKWIRTQFVQPCCSKRVSLFIL